ncbi:hypothetical protein, partial [Acinetobacter pittii]|uniref:hypothetical protein n=1 Tax=Acinetobacter pittii TaxID=48296 RepID=UPI00202A69F4
MLLTLAPLHKSFQQGLVQKHRRRKPLQWPPGKPSVWHTLSQFLSVEQGPLNLWLGVSHVLASTTIPLEKMSTMRNAAANNLRKLPIFFPEINVQ